MLTDRHGIWEYKQLAQEQINNCDRFVVGAKKVEANEGGCECNATRRSAKLLDTGDRKGRVHRMFEEGRRGRYEGGRRRGFEAKEMLPGPGECVIGYNRYRNRRLATLCAHPILLVP